MASYTDDIYFASLDPYAPRYLEALINKVNIYRKFCNETGKFSKWQRSMQNYYGISTDGTKSSNQVSRGGDQGQLVMAKINDYRNLLQHKLILITSQRPAGQARAINSDPDSLTQARIASSICEYYLSQVGWEQRFVKTAERMVVVDEGYLVLEFDPEAGDPIRPNEDTGKMISTGQTKLLDISPWNMARDPYLPSSHMMKWGIYSYRENKFDLAAKFPDKEKEILNSSSRKIKEIVFEQVVDKDTDQVTVYCLSHDKTPSCPLGRVTTFVPDAILLDGPFPYPEFNIYRMCENDVLDTSFGYSTGNDLLAIEEITDALHSAVMTNQITTGVNAIIAAKGMNVKHTEIAKGFPYFEVDPAHFDKIKTLTLTQTAPEIFNYIETLSRKKETLAGINSVVRGDPEGALRSNSGSALALVQAQSLQFNSGGQRAYYQGLSKVMTGAIKIEQTAEFGSNEKTIQIAGKVQSQFINSFKYTADSLRDVSSMVFEPVDPAFQSIGGKSSAASDLLSKGMIKNAKQYLTVVRTGSLDAFTEDDEASEIAVKAENESLRNGEDIPVIDFENHAEHIQTHMSLIATPESRRDPKLVASVTKHLMEHAWRWQTLSQQNPAILIATKQQVLPPPPPPPGAMPPQGPPGPGGPPPPQAGPPPGLPPQGQPHPGGGPMPMKSPGMAQLLGPKNPLEQKASEVKQPLMPKNPLSGERVPPPPNQA